MLDIARNLSASASVHALTGSSRPGAVPPTSIATPLAMQPSCPHDVEATCGHVDAEVIDLAGRVKALARRDHRIWSRRAAIEDTVDASLPALPSKPEATSRGTVHEVEIDGMRITTITTPIEPDPAYVAAMAAHEAAVGERNRLEAEMEARLGYPRWEKLSKRTFARLVRWTERLTLLQPRTEDGLKAKAEVQSVLATTGNSGQWTAEFNAAVGRDAVRMATAVAAARHPDAELLALAQAWEASAARCDATTEARDAAEERWQAGTQDEAGLAAAQAADAEAGKENFALRRRILAMPARTLDGILLKARVARWCFMDDEDEIALHLAGEAKDSGAAGETMAFSILLDLARMVGAPAVEAPNAGTASNIQPVPLPAGIPARTLGTAAAEDVREWYRSWLYAELRLLNLELDGSPEVSAVRQDNPGADFHFPAAMSWRDVPKPSTRAAAVLGMVGVMPASGADAAALPTATAA